MLLLLRVLFTAITIGGAAWSVYDVSFESVLAALGGLAALVGTFVVPAVSNKAGQMQRQRVGRTGVGIQAGRDVHIGRGTRNDQ